MNRYEDHEQEWKEEDRKPVYVPWIDPRDPNYIGPEDEEE